MDHQKRLQIREVRIKNRGGRSEPARPARQTPKEEAFKEAVETGTKVSEDTAKYLDVRLMDHSKKLQIQKVPLRNQGGWIEPARPVFCMSVGPDMFWVFPYLKCGSNLNKKRPSIPGRGGHQTIHGGSTHGVSC